MFTKCERQGIAYVLFASLILLVCGYRTELNEWLTSAVGTSNIPMYVYMYPMLAALIAATCAIYAAHRAYAAALLSDKREREFRHDELQRQRVAYSCDLFYELGSLLSTCASAPFTCKTLEESLAKKDYSFIDRFVDKEIFSVPLEPLLDWNIHSCLEVDTLGKLFSIRSKQKFIERTTMLIKDTSSVAVKLQEMNRSTDASHSMIKLYLGSIKKDCEELEKEIDDFRLHLQERYSIIKPQ